MALRFSRLAAAAAPLSRIASGGAGQQHHLPILRSATTTGCRRHRSDAVPPSSPPPPSSSMPQTAQRTEEILSRLSLDKDGKKASQHLGSRDSRSTSRPPPQGRGDAPRSGEQPSGLGDASQEHPAVGKLLLEINSEGSDTPLQSFLEGCAGPSERRLEGVQLYLSFWRRFQGNYASPAVEMSPETLTAALRCAVLWGGVGPQRPSHVAVNRIRSAILPTPPQTGMHGGADSAKQPPRPPSGKPNPFATPETLGLLLEHSASLLRKGRGTSCIEQEEARNTVNAVLRVSEVQGVALTPQGYAAALEVLSTLQDDTSGVWAKVRSGGVEVTQELFRALLGVGCGWREAGMLQLAGVVGQQDLRRGDGSPSNPRFHMLDSLGRLLDLCVVSRMSIACIHRILAVHCTVLARAIYLEIRARSPPHPTPETDAEAARLHGLLLEVAGDGVAPPWLPGAPRLAPIWKQLFLDTAPRRADRATLRRKGVSTSSTAVFGTRVEAVRYAKPPCVAAVFVYLMERGEEGAGAGRGITSPLVGECLVLLAHLMEGVGVRQAALCMSAAAFSGDIPGFLAQFTAASKHPGVLPGDRIIPTVGEVDWFALCIRELIRKPSDFEALRQQVHDNLLSNGRNLNSSTVGFLRCLVAAGLVRLGRVPDALAYLAEHRPGQQMGYLLVLGSFSHRPHDRHHEEIMAAMREAGVVPNEACYDLCVKLACQGDDTDSALRWVSELTEEYPAYVLTADTFVHFLYAACRAHDMHLVRAVFTELQKHRVDVGKDMVQSCEDALQATDWRGASSSEFATLVAHYYDHLHVKEATPMEKDLQAAKVTVKAPEGKGGSSPNTRREGGGKPSQSRGPQRGGKGTRSPSPAAGGKRGR